MKNIHFKKYILGISVLSLPLFSHAQVPNTQIEGSTKFIAGGIGSDESRSIQAEAKNWPLMIELSQKDGMKSSWISEVSIVITDHLGNSILNQPDQGPLLLVGLKPGKYMVQATNNSVKMVRTIVINSGTVKKISFQWQ